MVFLEKAHIVHVKSNTTISYIWLQIVGGSQIYPLLPGDINITYNIQSGASNIIIRWNNNHNLTKALLEYTPINEMGRKLNTKSMKILKNDNNKTSPSEQLYALRQSVDNSTLKQFSIAVGGSDSSLVDIIIIGGIKLKEQFEVTLKTSRNSFRRTFSGYGRLFFNFSDKQSSAIYFFPVLFLLSEIYFFNTEHILKIFTTDVNIKYCVEVVINLMLSSKSTSHQNHIVLFFNFQVLQNLIMSFLTKTTMVSKFIYPAILYRALT